MLAAIDAGLAPVAPAAEQRGIGAAFALEAQAQHDVVGALVLSPQQQQHRGDRLTRMLLQVGRVVESLEAGRCAWAHGHEIGERIGKAAPRAGNEHRNRQQREAHLDDPGGRR
jgi:hypothetical protein